MNHKPTRELDYIAMTIRNKALFKNCLEYLTFVVAQCFVMKGQHSCHVITRRLMDAKCTPPSPT